MFLIVSLGSGSAQNLRFADLTHSIYGKCPPHNLIGPASLHFQIKSVWFSVKSNLASFLSLKKKSVNSRPFDSRSSEENDSKIDR